MILVIDGANETAIPCTQKKKARETLIFWNKNAINNNESEEKRKKELDKENNN